jgi:hypothetical protein
MRDEPPMSLARQTTRRRIVRFGASCMSRPNLAAMKYAADSERCGVHGDSVIPAQGGMCCDRALSGANSCWRKMVRINRSEHWRHEDSSVR